MKLEPITNPTCPSYPSRVNGRRKRMTPSASLLRNAAAAACAAGALWLGGCYGATPIGTPDEESFIEHIMSYDFEVDQPPLPDEPEVSPGAAPAPGFECGSVSEWCYRSAPGYFEGSLCADDDALTDFEVTAAGAYRFEISSGREFVLLDIIDQEGSVVATLGPESGSVVLELTAGLWHMAATPAHPDENPYAWFAVNISFAD